MIGTTLRHPGSTRRLFLIVAALVLAGCSVLEPKPDSSRYFLLRPIPPQTEGASLQGLVLGLGPVTMPEYLDRYEMLEFVGPYELRYSAQDRWIEPLGDQVRRTLADNLENLLRPDAVVDYPWFGTEGVGLQVEIEFDPIRLGGDGIWRGTADWALRDPTGSALERESFEFEIGREGVPAPEVAGGLSTELERLATEIGTAVRRHAR